MANSLKSSAYVLLIGSGRLATHLQHWNSILESPNNLLTWDRSQDPHLLKNHLKKTSLVWLAISDCSIVSFYENNLLGLDIPVVHFSGALHDERLLCAHPLMSFPKELLPEESYQKISFGLTGCQTLEKVLPHFKNKFFVLDASTKPLYHALCVVTGNFPQMLWKTTLEKFKSIQVPSAAVDTYINQVSENFIHLKNDSLTGPFVRKDEKTIENNINALSSDERLQNIYKVFFKEFYK